MTDNTATTLTNPDLPGYDVPTPNKETVFAGFPQIVSSVYNSRHDRQTRKIRADLVRDYIATSNIDNASMLQKIIRFLKG